VVSAGRTAPASSWPGSTHGRRGKLHGVLEEGLGGWDIPGSWQKKGPEAVASNGGRRCAAQCPAATRAAGEPRPLNRRSCLGEGFMASVHGGRRSQGMGGGDVRACSRVRRRRHWSVGLSRFRAARERVARGNAGMGANVGARPWDRWSQQGTGVRARSAARLTRPSTRRRARARTDAVQIRVALFKHDFLQFFQPKWPKV
jgi:hypothetical protein